MLINILDSKRIMQITFNMWAFHQVRGELAEKFVQNFNRAPNHALAISNSPEFRRLSLWHYIITISQYVPRCDIICYYTTLHSTLIGYDLITTMMYYCRASWHDISVIWSMFDYHNLIRSFMPQSFDILWHLKRLENERSTSN